VTATEYYYVQMVWFLRRYGKFTESVVAHPFHYSIFSVQLKQI